MMVTIRSLTAGLLLKACAYLGPALMSLGQMAAAQGTMVGGTVWSEGGDPLPGIHVFVEGGAGTVTAPDGTYRLLIRDEGVRTIVFSAVGFERETRDVPADAGSEHTINVVLGEALLETAEVVVTASRRAQLASLVPASVSVLPAEEIRARNVLTLDEALRHVSGVQMQDNQVNIRGSSGFSYNTGTRVLFLVDGSQMLSPDTDGVPLDLIPMSQVDQIEVLKGPGSALYGSGALGGVVNVITKDFPDRTSVFAEAFGGFYERARHPEWRAKWDGANDLRWFAGSRVSIASRMGRSSGYWLDVMARKDIGYMNLQKKRTLQLFGKVGWKASPTVSVDFLGGGVFKKGDSFLFWNGLSDALNPGTLALSPSATPNGSNDTFSDQFSFLPSIRAVVGSSGLITGRMRLFGTVIRPIDEKGNARSISDGTLGFRYGAEAQYDWMGSAGQSVTAGTSFDANTTRSSFFQTSDGGDLGSQPEYAAFVQGEIAPLTGLDVVAGVRFDAYGIEATKTITRLSPKVALSYASSEAFALRMAYGNGFRVASLAERFTDDQSFIPIFRNPEIRPETSTSYELGAKGWFEAGSAGRLVWDLALFWNDYADFIEPRFVRTGSGGETLFGFQFVNLTSGRIRGAEVGLLWRPGPAGLRFRIGYTYLDTEDRETGEALPFRPEHLLVTTAEAEPRDGLRFGLDYRVSSVPEKIDSDFALFVPDASVMVATYALDARASMRWGGFTASILIKNVLDYYYLERPAILAPPRNLTVRIEVDL